MCEGWCMPEAACGPVTGPDSFCSRARLDVSMSYLRRWHLLARARRVMSDSVSTLGALSSCEAAEAKLFAFERKYVRSVSSMHQPARFVDCHTTVVFISARAYWTYGCCRDNIVPSTNCLMNVRAIEMQKLFSTARMRTYEGLIRYITTTCATHSC